MVYGCGKLGFQLSPTGTVNLYGTGSTASVTRLYRVKRTYTDLVNFVAEILAVRKARGSFLDAQSGGKKADVAPWLCLVHSDLYGLTDHCTQEDIISTRVRSSVRRV